MRHIVTAAILIPMAVIVASGQTTSPGRWQAWLDAVLAAGKTESREVVRKKLIALTEELTKLLAQHPKDADLLAVLGDTHAYLGRNDQALKYLGQAIALQPKRARFVFLRGTIYEESIRRPAKALADYAKAFDLEPHRADYGIRQAHLLIRLKRTNEAIAVLKRVEAIKDISAKSYINLGSAWCAANQKELGLKAFKRARKLDPTLINAHANIGQVYQDLGKHEESLKAYQGGLKVRPDDWRIVAKTIQLHQALQQIPQRDKALKQLRKLYDSGKVDRPLFCREQFKHGGKNIMAFEYFKLEGERAVRYVFHVIDPKTGKSLRRFSLGSYEITNAIAREQGTIKAGQRLYHLDRYDPDGSHWTLGMYVDPKQITYEATRKRLIAALDGKLRPVSGTTTQPDR